MLYICIENEKNIKYIKLNFNCIISAMKHSEEQGKCNVKENKYNERKWLKNYSNFKSNFTPKQ